MTDFDTSEPLRLRKTLSASTSLRSDRDAIIREVRKSLLVWIGSHPGSSPAREDWQNNSDVLIHGECSNKQE